MTKIFFIIKSMRRILLFLASFLLLIGWLLFSQKPIQAVPWGDCLSCTSTNCCGSNCSSIPGYFCNNLGFGICFCDQETRWQPPTATPGPRPPRPTQPGATQPPGGGGPTPTGGYGGTESHPFCIHRSAINNQRSAISDTQKAISDTQLAVYDLRPATCDLQPTLS